MPAECQFGRANVVHRVVRQQPSLPGRRSEQRNRGGVVLLVDKPQGGSKGRRTRARGIRRDEPHLRERARNRGMGGWSELLRAGLCREHANRDQEGNEPGQPSCLEEMPPGAATSAAVRNAVTASRLRAAWRVINSTDVRQDGAGVSPGPWPA